MRVRPPQPANMLRSKGLCWTKNSHCSWSFCSFWAYVHRFSTSIRQFGVNFFGANDLAIVELRRPRKPQDECTYGSSSSSTIQPSFINQVTATRYRLGRLKLLARRVVCVGACGVWERVGVVSSTWNFLLFLSRVSFIGRLA